MADFRKQDHVKDVVDQINQTIKVGADGCTWKSSGCASIDGTLNWVIARHAYGEMSGDPRMRQTAANARIIKSTDFGKTWIRSAEENLNAPMFPGSSFATPYFIDYGRGRTSVDGADRYVYALSTNGFWDNGDTLTLGRVRRDRIGFLSGSDWESFTGGDGSTDTNWTRDVAGATPVLRNPETVGQTGAIYLAARRRYMMIGWYYPAGTGKLKDASTKTVRDFYEAPKAWGPWSRIASHTWSPQGYYCPPFVRSFSRPTESLFSLRVTSEIRRIFAI